MPKNTYESIYFVIAVFTDDTYSVVNKPTYYIISSPIFKYKNANLNSNYMVDSNGNLVNSDCMPVVLPMTTSTKQQSTMTTQTTPTTTTTTATTTTTTTTTTKTTRTTPESKRPVEVTTTTPKLTQTSAVSTVSLWDLFDTTSKPDITTRLKQLTQQKKVVYNKPPSENSGLKSAYANESTLIDMLNSSNRTILIDIVAKAPDCDLINLDYTRFFTDIKMQVSGKSGKS